MEMTNAVLTDVLSSVRLRMPDPSSSSGGLDLKDHQDHQDFLVTMVSMVLQEDLVELVKMETQEHPAEKDPQDDVDHQDHPASPKEVVVRLSSWSARFQMPVPKSAHPTWNRCVDQTTNAEVENFAASMDATWPVLTQL